MGLGPPRAVRCGERNTGADLLRSRTMRVGWLASEGAGGRDEAALADAAEELPGADEEAQVGLSRAFVGQSVCALVALDAHVGRDSFDVHVPVFERIVV